MSATLPTREELDAIRRETERSQGPRSAEEENNPLFPIMRALNTIGGIAESMFSNPNEFKPAEAGKATATGLAATLAGTPFDLPQVAAGVGGGVTNAVIGGPGLDAFDDDPGVFSRFGRGFMDASTGFEETVPGLKNVRDAELESIGGALQAGVPFAPVIAGMMGVPGPEDAPRMMRASRGIAHVNDIARHMDDLRAGRAVNTDTRVIDAAGAAELNTQSLDAAREAAKTGSYAAPVDMGRALTPRKVKGSKGATARGARIEDHYAESPVKDLLDPPNAEKADTEFRNFVVGREPDVGRPPMERFELPDSGGMERVIIGGALDEDAGDFERLVDFWLDPDETLEFATWYEEVGRIARGVAGGTADPLVKTSRGADPDVTARFAMGQLAGQKNLDPLNAHRGNIRTLMQTMGEPARFVAPGKRPVSLAKPGRLADAELTTLARGGKLKTGSRKIRDFFDSMWDMASRGVYRYDPRSGAPYVVDLHMKRLHGIWDDTTLKKMDGTIKRADGSPPPLTKQQTAEIRQRQGFKSTDQPTPHEYEYMGQQGRRITDRWNKMAYLGKTDWKPKQTQAVLWKTQMRITGDIAPRPSDLLSLGDARAVRRSLGETVAAERANAVVANSEDATRFVQMNVRKDLVAHRGAATMMRSPDELLDRFETKFKLSLLDQTTGEVFTSTKSVGVDKGRGGVGGIDHWNLHPQATPANIENGLNNTKRFVRGYDDEEGKFFTRDLMENILTDARVPTEKAFGRAAPPTRRLTELYLSGYTGEDMQIGDLFDAYRRMSPADKQLLDQGKLAQVGSSFDAAATAVKGEVPRVPNRVLANALPGTRPRDFTPAERGYVVGQQANVRDLNVRPVGKGMGIGPDGAEPSVIEYLDNVTIEEARAIAGLQGAKHNQHMVNLFTPGEGNSRKYTFAFDDIDDAERMTNTLQGLGVEYFHVDTDSQLIHIVDESRAYDFLADDYNFAFETGVAERLGEYSSRADAKKEFVRAVREFDSRFNTQGTQEIFNAGYEQAEALAGRGRKAAVAGGSTGTGGQANGLDLFQSTTRRFNEAALAGQDPLAAVARGGF